MRSKILLLSLVMMLVVSPAVSQAVETDVEVAETNQEFEDIINDTASENYVVENDSIYLNPDEQDESSKIVTDRFSEPEAADFLRVNVDELTGYATNQILYSGDGQELDNFNPEGFEFSGQGVAIGEPYYESEGGGFYSEHNGDNNESLRIEYYRAYYFEFYEDGTEYYYGEEEVDVNDDTTINVNPEPEQNTELAKLRFYDGDTEVNSTVQQVGDLPDYELGFDENIDRVEIQRQEGQEVDSLEFNNTGDITTVDVQSATVGEETPTGMFNAETTTRSVAFLMLILFVVFFVYLMYESASNELR